MTTATPTQPALTTKTPTDICPQRNRSWEVILVAVIFVLVALHFVHLRADFPMRYWNDTAAYTDEGWWSSAAVAAFNTGHWHITGDYNPAVATPVYPAILFVVFKMLSGSGLLAARVLGVSCFALVLLFGYLFAKQLEGRRFALLAAAMFSTGFYVFAYSRLALLEFPMMVFVMAALCVAVSTMKRPLISGISIGLLLGIASLVKMAGIVAVVPIAYLLFVRTSSRKQFLTALGVALATISAITLPYLRWISSSYAADFNSFMKVQGRLDLAHSPLKNCIAAAFRAVIHGLTIGTVIYPLALLGGVLCLTRGKRFLKQPIFTASLLWILVYWAYLSARAYAPSRYYTVICWPVLFLLLVSIRAAHSHNRRLGIAAAAVVLACMLVNVYRVAHYLAHPRYTFYDMSSDVHERINERSSRNRILLGHFAKTVALANYLPSLCDDYGSMPPDAKLSTYDPAYALLSHPIEAPVTDIDAAVNRRYDGKLLTRYFLSEGDEQSELLLYELEPKEEKLKVVTP